MEHLDAHSWQALQARRPDAVTHFREHLRTPCPTCEAFLAQTWGGDALEAAVDAALLSLAPQPGHEQPFDEEGFARIRRQLAPRRRARWAWVAVVAPALAALLAVVVLLPRLHTQGTVALPEEGIKGRPTLQLELSAVARAPDGGLVRIAPGQAVSPSDVLLFRYHASAPGAAVLAQVVDGQVEVLGAFTLLPGTHDLRVDGELAGASLEGERGAVTFVLAARPGEHAPSLARVEAALAPDAGERERLATGTLEVRVEPGETPH